MINHSQDKELTIVGGPNGAGKTTLAREIIADQYITYISADDIAYELAPNNPESVRVQAGKEFFKRLEAAVKKGENVLIESTLAGRSLASLVNKYRREYDYKIAVVFVFLDDADICINRIAARVEKGGHSVPIEDIKRRFSRSIFNFWNLYKNLSNKWHLYYNSDDSFEVVARFMDNQQAIFDEQLFNYFINKAKYYG